MLFRSWCNRLFIRSTLNGQAAPEAKPSTTTETARAPISALDQAMAATLAAITVPSPQNGIIRHAFKFDLFCSYI